MELRLRFKRPALARCVMVGALLVVMGFHPRCATAGQNVVVVLDDSGSMNEHMRNTNGVSKMDAAKSAMMTVLSQLPPDAKVGVVLLNAKQHQGKNWLVPLGPVDTAEIQQAVAGLSANGGTQLGHFLKVGTDELLDLRGRDHYGNYRLLVVTDGEANDKKLVERYLPEIMARGVTVDVIGVDMRSDHSLATKVHTYRRANDPESLTQAIREVFAETSDDQGDASDSDFELLAALPVEVAVGALKALGEAGNEPIGERSGKSQQSVFDRFQRQGSSGANNANSNRPNQPSGSANNQPGNEKSGGSLLPILFVVFFVIVTLLNGGKTKQRRR